MSKFIEVKVKVKGGECIYYKIVNINHIVFIEGKDDLTLIHLSNDITLPTIENYEEMRSLFYLEEPFKNKYK